MSDPSTKKSKQSVRQKTTKKPAKKKAIPAKAEVKSARRPSLHPKTHQLLAKALSAVSVSAGTQRYQATLTRLILLLESYGRMNPVLSSTPISAACWDTDTLAVDINERWNFPPGNGYQHGQIDGGDPAATLAKDIDNRGGVLNGK